MYNRRQVIKAGLSVLAAAISANGETDISQAALEGSGLSAARLKLNFNQDYKFSLGDFEGASKPGFNDGDWGFVCLPHCFSAPYWGETKFYVGYGWYRRHFDVPAGWTGKRLALEFEGAFQDAEVFVNGTLVGHHKGGYTGFVVDITAAAQHGTNLLAVRLNNNWDAQTAPRAGEHQFAGGIYRNVWLHVTNPVHIPYCGISLTTPTASATATTVDVNTTVINTAIEPKDVTVRTVIFDPAGKVAARVESTQIAASGQATLFKQVSPSITNPMLWHPDHPDLYTVASTVLIGGVVVDQVDTPLGIRWFEFTAETGFFLNGEHYLIKGANVHQDHAGWCNAVTDAGFLRDIQMVKDAGFNFIRGSHYPHAPTFYEACDRIGILLWSELCFWGMGNHGPDGYWTANAYPSNPDDQPGFERSCKNTLIEMISQRGNNPSVIVWSMCNEVFFSDQSVMPLVRNLLGELVALSHQLDPTRPAGIGGCQRGGLDKIGDVAGYNGDGAKLFIDPGIANVVTEYGSCGDARPGLFDPCYGDTARQPDFPWRSGKTLWCMFDHGSIANIGRLGCVDYFRIPKRRWYWYKQNYAGFPAPSWPQPGPPAAIQLSSTSASIRNDGTDDCQIVVTIVDSTGTHISSDVPVTLTIESGPGQFPTGREIPFVSGTDIPIIDGLAAIEFRSQYPGRANLRATSPGLTDGLLSINITGNVSGVNQRQAELPTVLTGPVSQKATPLVQSLDANIALDRPTLASSEAVGHPASLGNDSLFSTYWSSASDLPGSWWQVDLENIYVVKLTALTLLTPGAYHYQIQLSTDQTNWTTAIDRNDSTNVSTQRTDTLPAGSVGRFLRITFVTVPANTAATVCDMTVQGLPWTAINH